MRILAAGSLRVVWPQLMTAFQADAVCDFGPAGLLRERIEAGEACDFLLRRIWRIRRRCWKAGGRCGSRLYDEPFVSERAGAGDA